MTEAQAEAGSSLPHLGLTGRGSRADTNSSRPTTHNNQSLDNTGFSGLSALQLLTGSSHWLDPRAQSVKDYGKCSSPLLLKGKRRN